MGKSDSSYNWTEGGFQLEKDLGPHWETWDDLETDVRRWAQKRYILLRCVDSKRAEIYNNKREKPFVKGHKSYIDPTVTEFAYKTFACVHGGRRKSKKTIQDSESQLSHNVPRRKGKTLNVACKFRIHAAYKPHLKAIVITNIIEEETAGSSCSPGHNHPATKDMFERYPQNLKMTEGEVMRQEELLSMGVGAAQAARLLRGETGKPFTAKHIHNERARIKERARGGRTDLQVVKQMLSDFQARFSSLKYEICTRSRIFRGQEADSSHGEESASAKFSQEIQNVEVINILLPGGMEFGRLYGEVILLDGTYNTNSLSYPLTLVSVEDSFGFTRIVQMSIVVSENEETTRRALNLYKNHVGESIVQTVIIDKDCREQAAIRNAFPGVRILLCRWHVIKYMYQMISEKVVGSMELKRALRQTTKDMAYAKTEEEYMNLYNEFSVMLNEQDSADMDSFIQYFDRNWHEPTVRSQWTQYGRFGCVTFDNDTNNRAEAMNGVVKKRTKRGFRLKNVIAALLEISDEGVFNFKNLAVKATMYVPVKGRTSILASFFMKHTTEKGCKALCREAAAMTSLRVEPVVNVRTSSELEENESFLLFEVFRIAREEIVSEGGNSGVSAHRVRMSMENRAKIWDALKSTKRKQKHRRTFSGDRSSEGASASPSSRDAVNILEKNDDADERVYAPEASELKNKEENSNQEIVKDTGSEADSKECLREEALTEELDGSTLGEANDIGSLAGSDSEEHNYMLCPFVDSGANGEEALLRCDCAAFFSYGELPCRHILAVLEHEFHTAAILLTIPRRWWVRTAVRIAQEIHATFSAKESSPSGSGEFIPICNSRREVAARAASLGPKERLPVFQKLCMDLAYLCSDSAKVPPFAAANVMEAVEVLIDKVREKNFAEIGTNVSDEAADLKSDGDEDFDNLRGISNPKNLVGTAIGEEEGLKSIQAGKVPDQPFPKEELETEVPAKGDEEPLLISSQCGRQPVRPKMSERKRRAVMNISSLRSSIAFKRRRRAAEGVELEVDRKYMSLASSMELFLNSNLCDLQNFVVDHPESEFPTVLGESSCNIRRFISSSDSISQMLRKDLRVCSDFDLSFALGNAGHLHQEAVRKMMHGKKGELKDSRGAIRIEKCTEDSFGAVVEVLAGPHADAYFFTIRQLKLMADTVKAMRVWQEAKRLLLWVSRISDLCAFEEKDASTPRLLSISLSKKKIEVLHAAALIQSVVADLALCSLSAGKEVFQKDGVLYDLKTLVSIRGNISNRHPLWLHSDLIQAYLCRLAASLPSSLKSFTFFMPMFEWMPTPHAQKYCIDVFLERLRSENHPILDARGDELKKGLIYAVCNVGNTHWTAVEVDIPASVVFLYDPAIPVGSMLRKNHADRLLPLLRCICRKKGLSGCLSSTTRVVQAPGGQQELASDSYNCGVHALLWVQFRILQAASLAAEELKKAGKVLKRTSRKVMARNKRMRDRTPRELDLARLAMLYDICRFIDMSKCKDLMRGESEKQ